MTAQVFTRCWIVCTQYLCHIVYNPNASPTRNKGEETNEYSIGWVKLSYLTFVPYVSQIHGFGKRVIYMETPGD